MANWGQKGCFGGFVHIEETEGCQQFAMRYLVLDLPNNVLSWYIEEPQKMMRNPKPAGQIGLCYISMVTSAARLRPKVPHCFVINTGMKKIFMHASSPAEMATWIETLNNACKVTVIRNDTGGELGLNVTLPQESAYRTEVIGGVVVLSRLSQSPETKEGTEAKGSHGWYSSISGVEAAVIKTGYCVKQGLVMKTWRRRYFVLDENMLRYYKSEEEKEPIKVVQVKDIKNAKESKNAMASMRDNLFEIITNNRTFLVQADSPLEMQNWIGAINSTCKGLGLMSFMKPNGGGVKEKVSSPSDKSPPVSHLTTPPSPTSKSQEPTVGRKGELSQSTEPCRPKGLKENSGRYLTNKVNSHCQGPAQAPKDVTEAMTSDSQTQKTVKDMDNFEVTLV
uniref:pleckstrin homology domain-containing family A member 1-like n=1 Tax=Myxine glutinosa TaxID=7769 RepID=UPI00358E77ED